MASLLRHSYLPASAHGRSTSPRVAPLRSPVATSAQPEGNKTKVIGMGSCGLDYLAQVASFPSPDDKLRTERLETQGGGNCANALTGVARLGLGAVIISQVGDDAVGDAIEAELQQDGVDTSHLLHAPGPSPFTYIIVDREGGTRTVPVSGALQALEGASLVYFDGRLTDAAVLLAQAARKANIPVLVEGERLRPGLDQLLEEADYVSTSARFPKEWTGELQLGDALTVLLQRLPRVRWLVTTLGPQGAVYIERVEGEEAKGAEEVSLDALLVKMMERADRLTSASAPAATSPTGARIGEPHVAGPGPVYRLQVQESQGHGAGAAAEAERAALAAAVANADGANSERYRGMTGLAEPLVSPGSLVAARIAFCTPAPIAKGDIVDTTGRAMPLWPPSCSAS
eukprot:jgi/Botrbrau1/17466/Bobra.0054s0053.1